MTAVGACHWFAGQQSLLPLHLAVPDAASTPGVLLLLERSPDSLPSVNTLASLPRALSDSLILRSSSPQSFVSGAATAAKSTAFLQALPRHPLARRSPAAPDPPQRQSGRDHALYASAGVPASNPSPPILLAVWPCLGPPPADTRLQRSSIPSLFFRHHRLVARRWP